MNAVPLLLSRVLLALFNGDCQFVRNIWTRPKGVPRAQRGLTRRAPSEISLTIASSPRPALARDLRRKGRRQVVRAVRGFRATECAYGSLRAGFLASAAGRGASLFR